MADILSQSEIDALLSAISTGEMDANELKNEEKKKKEKVYDFKRALRFSKDQVRSLTRIHENFARLLTTFFSAQLRTYVEVSVVSVDQIPYDEFIRSISSMTILNVFEAAPLDGRLLLEVNPHIAYAMVDRVLGGRGASMNKIDRLTEIETRIINQIFDKVLEVYTEAWDSILEFDTTIHELETNPQFLQLVSPNETVIVISISTMIGEASGMINICLPHVVLEPIMQKLSLHYWMQENNKVTAQAPKEAKNIEDSLKEADMALSVILGQTDITIEEFLNLNNKDVIKLDKSIREPLILNIGSQPKFFVQPGKRHNQVAVQVIDTIMKGEDLDDQ